MIPVGLAHNRNFLMIDAIHYGGNTSVTYVNCCAIFDLANCAASFVNSAADQYAVF